MREAYVFMAWCLVKYRIMLIAWYLVKHRDNFAFYYEWKILVLKDRVSVYLFGSTTVVHKMFDVLVWTGP
jgi:hypothetical protein